MKRWLKGELICPECVTTQSSLSLETDRIEEDDILEGRLTCPECGQVYPIRDGIAVVVPERTLPVTRETGGYNSAAMLQSYLWSHYSEFFNGPDATDAYGKWAAWFAPEDGWAIDIGCAVGRLSFELSRTHTRVVGVDTSMAFIREARKIASRRHLAFDMVVEGRVTKQRESDLDPAFRFDAAEFIVADATALPFPSDRFSTAASVNILEKVPDPARHLEETNRVLDKGSASFLFSDPFTWDAGVSDPDLWLGGRNSGPFAGRGMDVLSRIFEGEHGLFSPKLSIKEKGELLWKIRKTDHLWEHITSQFIIGKRDSQ